MKGFSYDVLQVIAFDAALRVPCSIAQPFVCHEASGQCFDLTSSESERAETDLTIARAEIDNLIKEGRITRLPEPVGAFPSASVLYATREFMDAVGSDWPATFNGQELKWQSVGPQKGAEIRATVASRETAAGLANLWAKQLVAKTTELLIEFFKQNRRALLDEAERIAKLARSAARDRRLRAGIYLRIAIAMMYAPESLERLDNLYLAIPAQFPYWKLKDLKAAARELAHTMQLVAEAGASFPNTKITSSFESAVDRVIIEDMLGDAKRISVLGSQEERLQEGDRAARKRLNSDDLCDADYERLATQIDQAEWIYVELENERLVRTALVEPACYDLGVLRPFQEYHVIDVGKFFKALEGYQTAGVEDGPIATFIHS